MFREAADLFKEDLSKEDKLIKNWHKLASQGDAEAQYKLGLCYEKESAYGFIQSKKMAMCYYKLAADQGYQRAKEKLVALSSADLKRNFYDDHLPVDGPAFLKMAYRYQAMFSTLDSSTVSMIRYHFLKAASLSINDVSITEALHAVGKLYIKEKATDLAIKYLRAAASESDQSPLYTLQSWLNNQEDKVIEDGKPEDPLKIFEYYQFLASCGIASVQLKLGSLYETGWIVTDKLIIEKNHNKAINYYLLAAKKYVKAGESLLQLSQSQLREDKNNIYALNGLGECYYHGYGGIKKNKEKAKEYFISAIDKGSEAAKINLQNLQKPFSIKNTFLNIITDAKIPLEKTISLKSPRFAILPHEEIFNQQNQLNDQACRGNLSAQLHLANAYLHQDPGVALFYYKLAMDQGHPVNQQISKLVARTENNYAYYGNYNNEEYYKKYKHYEKIDEIHKYSHFAALYWCRHSHRIAFLQMAANAGNLFSLREVQGRNRSLCDVINNLQMRATLNDPDAQFVLGEYYAKPKVYFDNDDIEENPLVAMKYYKLAGKNSKYVLRLKNCYEEKYGIPSDDPQLLIKYYKEAAKFNVTWAFYELGKMYKQRVDIKKNKNKVIKYYGLAAQQKHPAAAQELISFCQLPQLDNDISAMNTLGFCYQKGWGGIPKNIKNAANYFRLAISLGSKEGKEYLRNLNHQCSSWSFQPDNMTLLYHIAFLYQTPHVIMALRKITNDKRQNMTELAEASLNDCLDEIESKLGFCFMEIRNQYLEKLIKIVNHFLITDTINIVREYLTPDTVCKEKKSNILFFKKPTKDQTVKPMLNLERSLMR